MDRKVPVLGICLGLQGLVEHFGGRLGQLAYPMHGKPSEVVVSGSGDGVGTLFQSLPRTFRVARYHSLHALRPLPACLVETACSLEPGQGPAQEESHLNRDTNGAGIVMGVQHRTLPIAAVQFHPESILTSPEIGLQLLANAFQLRAA